MIWQLHAPTIVMTTNLDEGRKKKCERYWPEFGTAEYGPYSVTLAEQQVLADYVIRKLTVTVSRGSDLFPFPLPCVCSSVNLYFVISFNLSILFGSAYLLLHLIYSSIS